jgi:hypothetical protein
METNNDIFSCVEQVAPCKKSFFCEFAKDFFEKTLFALIHSLPCIGAWVACEVVFGLLLRSVGGVMAKSRRWLVESKEFELLIKGGASRVRIFERSNRKQRSIFLNKDELAWLVGTVKEVVVVETSKVFWDQSRAGYPRIITQKCSNKHGRFLTVEEFDGRRRGGAILIPEGCYGQGWERFVSEVRLANLVLHEVREVRERKKEEVRGRRSYVEVLGLSSQPEVDCFNSYSEPIARVPRWLKEASAEMDRQAKEEGKLLMAQKYNHALAKISGVQVMASTKTRTQLMMRCGTEETGGYKSKNGGIMRVMVRALVRNLLPLAKHFSGMMSTLNSATGLSRGQEEAVNHAGQSSFNVNLKLCNARGLLRRLKGEVAVGLARLDTVIQILKSFGPGQDSLVQKGVGSKGKEKMGAEGKSLPREVSSPRGRWFLSPR